jgi:hypothetical protein
VAIVFAPGVPAMDDAASSTVDLHANTVAR